MLVAADWQAIAGDLSAGGLLRFRADAAARIWPDGDAVRFAVEYGVPHSDGLFRILPGLAERDPGNPDSVFEDGLPEEPFDTPYGRFQPLGMVYQSQVFVRPADGTIWVCDPDHSLDDGPEGDPGHGHRGGSFEFEDSVFELVHRDLSSFSYLVYMIAAERPGPDEDPNPNDWADIKEILREDITAWDRLPFESGGHFWEMYLESYPML